jgi:colicin import membrane protein
MNLTRSFAGVGLLLAMLLAGGCSHAPLPEIPTGLRPRAEAMEPEMVSALSAEIEADRVRLTTAQTAEEAACYQQFAVTGCLLDVRARYRPQLAELNHRDIDVRAGDRQRHELERQARMEEAAQTARRDEERAAQRTATSLTQAQKQAQVDQRNADRAAAAPGNAARAQANLGSAQETQKKALADQAQRAADAPAERRQFEAKQKAAEERRAAQARRTEEQKTKPLAQPLPATPLPSSPGMPLP